MDPYLGLYPVFSTFDTSYLHVLLIMQNFWRRLRLNKGHNPMIYWYYK